MVCGAHGSIKMPALRACLVQTLARATSLRPALEFCHGDLFDGLEDVSLVVRDLEFIEQGLVFVAEALAGLVLFLVLDIADDRAELGVRIRKRAKALLPLEASRHPAPFVD